MILIILTKNYLKLLEKCNLVSESYILKIIKTLGTTSREEYPNERRL